MCDVTILNTSIDAEAEPELVVRVVEQRRERASELGPLPSAELALQGGADQPVRVKRGSGRPLVRVPLVSQRADRPLDCESDLRTKQRLT